MGGSLSMVRLSENARYAACAAVVALAALEELFNFSLRCS
jgi:hypothetical protein